MFYSFFLFLSLIDYIWLSVRGQNITSEILNAYWHNQSFLMRLMTLTLLVAGKH